MVLSSVTASASKNFPIIDVHNHIFPDHIAQRAAESIRDYYMLPMHGNGTLSYMLSRAEAYCIEHFLVCSAALKAEKVRTANEFIASLRLHDLRIVPLGTTHIDVQDQFEVFRQIEALGLAGIKIHPDFQGFAIDDVRLDDAWRESIRLNLPVLIHVGDTKSDLSSPRRIWNVMDRFPQLKIVAAHMGGFQMMQEAECLVGTHCFFDTSQWYHFMSEMDFSERIEKHGAEKIVFGSDYPLNTVDNEIERLMATELGETEKRKIFYLNAKRLFALE